MPRRTPAALLIELLAAAATKLLAAAAAKLPVAAFATLLALGATACRAQKTLTVTSDPPGAEVRLDRELVGVTPVTVPFLYYGVRRLTLAKAGYLTRSERIEIDGPWYGHFPYDLLSEIVFPVGWDDDHFVHWKLEPGVEAVPLPELRSVLARANALRRSGPEGPRELPPVRLSPTSSLPSVSVPPPIELEPRPQDESELEPVPVDDAGETDAEVDLGTDSALDAQGDDPPERR